MPTNVESSYKQFEGFMNNTMIANKFSGLFCLIHAVVTGDCFAFDIVYRPIGIFQPSVNIIPRD